ncbi:hypothetical protein HZS61_004428 [Fusarium oxysporum f. sp. conglutinans]|uniref:ABC transporter domain-containing protein n=1 Tax=Fusarium oxysporum f. sp. conglutinans TaxID=100902 RepID=A0A8H6LCV8_FUSOX|nr:hypothetical protein HZS61_004428 [Fusarium oxysporum f. sp. conglutinans]
MNKLSLSTTLWLRQTQALTKKILLITLVRHWLSTLIRCLVIPILVLSLALGVQNFTSSNNKYGIGKPTSAPILSEVIPDGAKLFIIQFSGAGSDVSAVIEDVVKPLGKKAQIEILRDEQELMEKCPTDINGKTDCYAAVIFNDSPLSDGGNKQWNYTMRCGSFNLGSSFDVFQSAKAATNPYIPLQLAIDQAITNSSAVPNMYMFTRTTQEQAKAAHRRKFIDMVLGGLNLVCFASMLSLVYHIVGTIALERESGMTQLIDVMGGGAFSARVLSYVIAFDVIYLPSWIILGGIYSSLLLPTSSAGITILWQILTGWALTSGCVFGATFAIRYSTILAVIALIGMAAFAQLLDSQTEPITAGVAMAFSIMFPSCSYVFVLNSMARYEKAGKATNIYTIPPSPGFEVQKATIGTLWLCLCLSIVAFPLVTIAIERFVHGVSRRGRQFKTGPKADNTSLAVQVIGVTKTYKANIWKRMCCFGKRRPVIAVNAMTFSSNKQQVLCLLGTNGSGKTTTMDLITGRQSLTDGSIQINAPASKIGFCPQRNIQWDELTVLEHVSIWDMIKGGTSTRARLERLVESCDLSLKMHSRVGTLSGGQKRKVQLACMLVGGSSVCLMDEVTTGMDPVSRRAIWNIVLAERSKRSIILTTHFLDECDVLADQVVLISRGHVKCQGSPAELKNLYGGGYRVHVPQIDGIPQTRFPAVVHRGETIFNTPDSASATRLLSSLEAAGLSDVVVSGPTIEHVFLQVANGPEESDKTTSGILEDDLTPLTVMDLTTDGELSSGTRTTFTQQLAALTVKRLTIFRSNFWWYIVAMTLPLAFSPGATSLLKVSDGIDTFPFELPLCVSSQPSIFDEPWPVDIAASGYTDEVGSGVMSMLVGPQSTRKSVFGVIDKFPIGGRYNSNNFDSDFTFQNGFKAFQNRMREPVKFTPGAIYFGDDLDKATIAYNPELGYDTPVLMQNLYSQAASGVPITVQLAFFSNSTPADAGSGLIAAIILAFLHSLYPAFFALYPTYEKLHKVRALQYSNNVRPYPLWASCMIFDMIFVTIIASLGTLALSGHVENWYFAGYMFPVMWLYGIASMLWSYIISLYATSELAAFGLTVCSMVGAFTITMIGFSLGATNPSPNSPTLALDAVSFSLGLLFPIMNLFRAMAVGLNIWLVSCRNYKLLTNPGDIHAYGGPIMLLVIQIIYLFPLLVWLDGQRSFSWPWRRTKQVNAEESISNNHHGIEMDNIGNEGPVSDLLRVTQVTKSFGGKLAVQNVSLAIGESSVIALLGPNGAGKTTLTNMMRGEMVPDKGRIYVQGVEVQENLQMARKSIGVCPQFDALDKITVRQQLNFYARIKGISSIKQNVELVMSKVGLTLYASRLTHVLSGGNKRKLSLAIALLGKQYFDFGPFEFVVDKYAGNPKVLILDEPSSAMDAFAKREMWKMLSSITSGRSVLLVTHSMEEADELATRVAIMSKRILAIGTSQQLRKQYSNAHKIGKGSYHVYADRNPSVNDINSDWVQWVTISSFALQTLDKDCRNFFITPGLKNIVIPLDNIAHRQSIIFLEDRVDFECSVSRCSLMTFEQRLD